MSRLLRRRTILSIAASLVVAASALTQAQERRGREGSASPKPANPNAERASGVILKVEPITKGASSGSTIEGEAKKGRASKVSHRLTINTAAVWRDWARDQVVEKPTESPKAEATKGANSVATKGEPADKVTLVVIDLGPETRVHTRFRLVSDETSRGYRTPEEARTANHDPAAQIPCIQDRTEAFRKIGQADAFQSGRSETRSFRRDRFSSQASAGRRLVHHRDPTHRTRTRQMRGRASPRRHEGAACMGRGTDALLLSSANVTSVPRCRCTRHHRLRGVSMENHGADRDTHWQELDDAANNA